MRELGASSTRRRMLQIQTAFDSSIVLIILALIPPILFHFRLRNSGTEQLRLSSEPLRVVPPDVISDRELSHLRSSTPAIGIGAVVGHVSVSPSSAAEEEAETGLAEEGCTVAGRDHRVRHRRHQQAIHEGASVRLRDSAWLMATDQRSIAGLHSCAWINIYQRKPEIITKQSENLKIIRGNTHQGTARLWPHFWGQTDLVGGKAWTGFIYGYNTHVEELKNGHYG